VKNPDLDAVLMGKWIASELENRQSFRSTQKKAIQRMRKAGAVGCRTQCQGRLGGAEIARREGYKEGVVPLETLTRGHRLRHIDAATAYGRIGVKVWICRSTNKVNRRPKRSPSKEEALAGSEATKKEVTTMLQPKRVKYRRPHGLKYEGIASKAINVDFGEYGLQALEGDYVTDHQIEAARIVLARYTDRAGKIWIRIFPHMAKTKKPAEVRMGSGKGNPEGWVAVVKKAECSSRSAASPMTR
jgi:large subunit ribosomal protein L16